DEPVWRISKFRWVQCSPEHPASVVHPTKYVFSVTARQWRRARRCSPELNSAVSPLYRRFLICGLADPTQTPVNVGQTGKPNLSEKLGGCRPTDRLAECNSAIQQIKNLRYTFGHIPRRC